MSRVDSGGPCVVFQLVVGLMSQGSRRPAWHPPFPSLFVRSRSSCETADAGEWCKDQALDDGHQQETLDASIASTIAAIEKFAANLRLSVWTYFRASNSSWIVSCNGEFTNNGFRQEEYPAHGDSFTFTPQQRAVAKLQVEPWIALEVFPTNTMSTDNARVNEAAQESTL